MEQLKHTLIENNHPRMRRKNASIIDNFLKQTFANSFQTFIESQNQLSERPTLKQSEEMIQLHYKKLHTIIDSIDQHLARRLQNHENEVFTIVKDQIQQMRTQTQEIVEKLNNAIKQKNIEDEIYQLSNQLDYFKSQTYRLFQENKKLRQDMKIMKKQVKESEIELENSDRLMQKLKQSAMKAKINNNKLSQNLKSNNHFKLADKAVEKSITSFSKNKYLKTDYSDLKDHKNGKDTQFAVQLPKQSIINIKTSLKKVQGGPFTTNIDETDPLSHDFSFQDSCIYRTGSENGLPKVNMVKVISQVNQQILSHDQKRTKHQQIQTDPLFSPSQPFFQESKMQPIFGKKNCVNYTFASPQKEKQIDLLKSGFYVKTYDERSKSKNNIASIHSISKKETQARRYMNNTFNRNKIANQKDSKIRAKTTMHS